MLLREHTGTVVEEKNKQKKAPTDRLRGTNKLTSSRSRRPLCSPLAPLSVSRGAPPHARRLPPTAASSSQTSQRHRARAPTATGKSCRPPPPPPRQLLSAAGRPRRCPQKSTKVGKLPGTRRSQLLCRGSAWRERLVAAVGGRRGSAHVCG